MKFRLEADAEIEAESLDHAYGKLALHLISLMNDQESGLIESGEMYVFPAEDR